MLVVLFALAWFFVGVVGTAFLFLLGNGRVRSAGGHAAAHFLAHKLAVAQAQRLRGVADFEDDVFFAAGLDFGIEFECAAGDGLRGAFVAA